MLDVNEGDKILYMQAKCVHLKKIEIFFNHKRYMSDIFNVLNIIHYKSSFILIKKRLNL